MPELKGRPRALPAVVHVRAATAACSELIARESANLVDLVEELDPYVVPERVVRAHVDPTAFMTVDTPNDFRIAASRLAACSARD